MRKAKSSKQAMLKSGLALLMCIAMLVSSTFAWFTDQVTSAGNIIQSGNLKIDMQWADEYNGDNTAWKDAAGENAEPVFDYQNWEPGYTVVRYIKVSNEGNLAFKWLMNILPVGVVGKLAEVIDVNYDIVTDNSRFTAPTADNKSGSLTTAGTLADVINGDDTVVQGVLLPEGKEADGFYSGEVIACITLHMQESAGNEYQNESIGDSFNILLKATQYNFENDSFGNDYDLKATYPSVVTNLKLKQNVSSKVEDGKLTEQVVFTDTKSGITVTLPVGTEVEKDELNLKIVEDDVNKNITLDQRVGYDVEVDGVAQSNAAVILVSMPKMLPANMSSVQLYHDGEVMQREFAVADINADEFYYDENTGDVTFGMTHFSNVSGGASTSVYVNGVKYDGVEIDLNAVMSGTEYKVGNRELVRSTSGDGDYIEGNYNLVIPNDGNVYVLTFDSGDRAKRNEVKFSGTWHESYNLNPGDSSDPNKQWYPYGIIVEDGATVILNNASIRADWSLAHDNRVTDAIRVGYELSEINYMNANGIKYHRGNGLKTKILVADGSYNCLLGNSGIGFGYYTGADVIIEGNGCLYTAALRNGCPGIGVSINTDGGATSYAASGPKVSINVGWLVTIPMKGAAGIGGGNRSGWCGLSRIEINGGAMQAYSGADAAAIGGAKVGNTGEIVINGGKLQLFCNPENTQRTTLGMGHYGGSCAGIYISKDADIYYGTGMSWEDSYADEKVNGFDPMLNLEIIDNNEGRYSLNDSLNLTVKANRKYGGAGEVTNYTISGIDTSIPGVQSGTITYKENGNTLTATISDIRVITPVKMTVEPKRSLYNLGEVKADDFKVTVYDSTGVATTLSDFDISVDGNINTAGHVNVTVSKDDMSATCTILMWNVTKLDGTNKAHPMCWMSPGVFNVSGWANHKVANATYETFVGQTYTVPGTGEVVSGFSYKTGGEYFRANSKINFGDGFFNQEFIRDDSSFDLTITNASRFTTLGINCYVGYDAPVTSFGYYFDNDMSTLKFTGVAYEGDAYTQMVNHVAASGMLTYLGAYVQSPNYLTCDLYDFKPGSTHTVHWVAIFNDGIQTLGDWTVTLKTENKDDAAYEVDPNKPYVNVVVLAGQSNAAGSAPITNEIRAQYGNKQFSNVFINYNNLNVDGNTATTYFTNGNNFDMYKLGIGGFGANYFGPELGLADYLSTSAPNESWYIIKYAPAGSELDRQWFGDAKLADRMIGYVQDKINILSKDYNVKLAGFVWMQGESDAAGLAAGVAERYSANEQKLVTMVRNEFAAYGTRNSTALNTPGSGIVFVNGGISASGFWPEHATVNNAKKANCAWWLDPITGGFTNPGGNIANALFVDTSTLISKNQSYVAGLDDYGNAQDNSDQAHYSDESMVKLGTWFGNGLRSMIINCP